MDTWLNEDSLYEQEIAVVHQIAAIASICDNLIL